MRLHNTIITTIFALLVGTAVAKNVVNPNFDENQIKAAVLEFQQEEFRLGKREAKNVVDLNLKLTPEESDIYKRDSKNTFGVKLIVDEGGLFKRHAKNTFDMDLKIDDASIVKRDGKNIFHLDFLVDGENLEKRDADAKDVVDIHIVIDDDSELIKREVENVIDIGLTLPSDHALAKSLQEPVSLGFLIGSQEFTASEMEKVSSNSININLKHDSTGCHGKKKKIDLQSLAEVLDTFKAKMFDPTIEAKDKFSNGDSPITEESALDPIKGDIASAIVQRQDLGLFSKYLRESPELFKKCETELEDSNISNESNKQILIFAPTNDALKALEKKPWQFPEDIESAKSEDEQDTMIQRNILNFVQSHFVETDKFNLSGESKAVEFTSTNGNVIVLENSGYNFKLKLKGNDGWIDITDIEVLSNGAILTINSVIL